ncbi:MAG: AAA family ATPase, partial [Nitrospiraceae bacterium]
MFPGGIANKLGNRFEAKWTVQKLLEVFLGQAESLRFESIDPVDHGVEFSLIRCGQNEWHQTKKQETKGNWTVRGLERKAVLTNALKKVAAGDNQRFVFVSETPAQGLHDLSEKANIARTARAFESTLSDRETGELHALNDVWKTKTEQAWEYLKRCRFEVVGDRTLDACIGLLAGLAFTEPTDTIFPLLRDYLESNFNRDLRAEDLRKELIESKRLTPHAPFDLTLRECLNQATQRYLESYSPFGVGGERISRRQAKEVLGLLVEENGPNVVLLTGSAGVGKSGVVREVIEELMERGISHLAFRVDRHLTIQSTRNLGQALFNRPADPVVTLASLGGRDVSVLIIDQIDAVSEASGRIGPMRDIVFDLARTAQASGCVRIVAVCRSFDLTNDATLRTMEQNEKVQRIEVAPLDWEHEIKPLLLAKEVNTDQITLAQRALLTLPLNLSLFLEVVTPDGRTIPFSSTSDLHSLLVERKQRAIRERG